jgi:hypothetical protein
MKDIHNQLRVRNMLGPISLAADNTPAAFDLQGFRGAMLEIGVGIGGITFDPTNKIEFKLRHGDTATVGAHVDVVAADVEIINPDGTKGVVGAGGIVRALIAAHAAATVTKVGYIGNKRFLSLLADFSGTHGSPTPIAIKLVQGSPERAPAGV